MLTKIHQIFSNNSSYVEMPKTINKNFILTYGVKNLIHKEICAGEIYFNNSFDSKHYSGHYEIFTSSQNNDNNFYVYNYY